ncbi:hypothetical protein FHW77_001567 [Agrobacterium sp. RC10-4-1]|uniref:beta-sandwich lipoprotein n=1 Tax=Agrobacterium sp. RC10-4-1 TaxID=2587039 RepID=UPI0015FC093E|nr:hypothetical protein [Agrobacterium sp. RC10-4-1]MBA8797885.1 hypothetical protein [Agrobacterium sp. RC10-4-1]
MNRIAIAIALAASVTLTACSDDAQIASQNLSKAADNFEVSRRIIFYNGITDTYMLTIEGLCSISVGERKLDVTCKTGPGQYKKHFLGLSDNVTFFAEQLEGKSVSAYHYRVTFKPQSIIPDVNFRGDGKELTANH